MWSQMLNVASVFPYRHQRPEALEHASGTGGSISENNVAGYPRMDDRVAVFQVHCSDRELSSLKNIKKDRKKAITKEGSGKNREEGEKLWEQKGPAMVEDVTGIIEENDILYMQGNNTAGGGTSGPLEPLLVAEVLSQHVVESGVLQTILPRLNEDPVILENTVHCIQDTGKLIDGGDIYNWILIQNGRIAKNDVDFKNTDLNIARVEEIILRSLIIPSNTFDVSDYFGDQMLRSKPKYRISTKGYARKQLNRRHNGVFAGEYIEDLTTKAINENWLGADLTEQCQRAYFVIRADPKHITENNLNLIQNVAQNILPKTAVTVAKYPVNRAQTIEIAALFIGIKTKIIQDYQARLSEMAPTAGEEDEEEQGSVWESLGFDHNPNAETPRSDVP